MIMALFPTTRMAQDNYLREINELKEEKTDSESALHEILQRISNSIEYV